MNNHLFILGATGYIGQVLVKQLLAAGYQVDALVRNPNKTNALSPEVNIIPGDLLEPATWLHHLDNKEAVINTAFPSHGDSWAAGVHLEQSTLNQIVTRLRNQHTKLIISNGSAFLGDSGDRRLKESDPIQDAHPASIRGRSLEAIRQQSTSSLSIIELRLASFIYGQGGSVFLPALIQAAKKHRRSMYIDQGAFYTSTLHVAAAARAYLQALQYGQAGEVYHIAGDEEPSIQQIAKAVALATGTEFVSVAQEESLQYLDPFTAMFLQQNNRLDNQKARRELHWSGHTEASLFYDVAFGSYAN